MSFVIRQELHPAERSAVHAEYEQLHENVIQYITPIEAAGSWNPSLRKVESPFAAIVPKLVDPAVHVIDREFDCFGVRICTPHSVEVVRRDLPILEYVSGGGWAFGGRDSDAYVCTRLAVETPCIVVKVDHRLAPEHPFPAAHEDCWKTLLWLLAEGAAAIGGDRCQVAVGGSSSGGNLAAAMALMARETPIRLTGQVLIVTVLDTTSEASGRLKMAAWLIPGRLDFFIDNYLPDVTDRLTWQASPLLAPDTMLKDHRLAKAWIGVAGRDLVRRDGELYASRLDGATLVCWEGVPHPVLQLSDLCQIPVVEQIIGFLRNSFQIDQRKLG